MLTPEIIVILFTRGQCTKNRLTCENYTANYKIFQEHQLNSRRFPGAISNSRRFPGVVDNPLFELPVTNLPTYLILWRDLVAVDPRDVSYAA